ncbi:MAG: AAA family ATPase [Desulfobacteraceae bacterium]|nr:AAA family ATPase [Desulfobacteraceae bacterium]
MNTNKTLIIGDWSIDEFLMLDEFYSKTSAHIGDKHYIVNVGKDKQHKKYKPKIGFCMAGHVAKILLKKDLDKSKIIGMGFWCEEDKEIIYRLLTEWGGSDKKEILLDLSRSITRSKKNSVNLDYLKNLSEPSNERITRLVTRNYGYDKNGKAKQLNRIDREGEYGFTDETKVKEKIIENINSINLEKIIIVDRGSGEELNNSTIDALWEKRDSAKWYIRTKDYKAGWLQKLQENKAVIDLLVFGPEIISDINPTKKLLTGNKKHIVPDVMNVIRDCILKENGNDKINMLILISRYREIIFKIEGSVFFAYLEKYPENQMEFLGWTSSLFALMINDFKIEEKKKTIIDNIAKISKIASDIQDAMGKVYKTIKELNKVEVDVNALIDYQENKGEWDWSIPDKITTMLKKAIIRLEKVITDLEGVSEKYKDTIAAHKKTIAAHEEAITAHEGAITTHALAITTHAWIIEELDSAKKALDSAKKALGSAKKDLDSGKRLENILDNLMEEKKQLKKCMAYNKKAMRCAKKGKTDLAKNISDKFKKILFEAYDYVMCPYAKVNKKEFNVEYIDEWENMKKEYESARSKYDEPPKDEPPNNELSNDDTLPIIANGNGGKIDLSYSYSSIGGYIAFVNEKNKEIDRMFRKLREFRQNPLTGPSISFLVKADAGTGKTTLLKLISKEFDFQPLNFDMTQICTREDIVDLFDQIANAQASNHKKPVLVLVDEVNAKINSDYVYSAFLSPVESRAYYRKEGRYDLKPCAWIFITTGEDEKAMTKSDKYRDFQSRLTGNIEIGYNSIIGELCKKMLESVKFLNANKRRWYTVCDIEDIIISLEKLEAYRKELPGKKGADKKNIEESMLKTIQEIESLAKRIEKQIFYFDINITEKDIKRKLKEFSRLIKAMERIKKQAQAEQMYYGVKMILDRFPSVNYVSMKILRYFYDLHPIDAPFRKINNIVKTFNDVHEKIDLCNCYYGEDLNRCCENDSGKCTHRKNYNENPDSDYYYWERCEKYGYAMEKDVKCPNDLEDKELVEIVE